MKTLRYKGYSATTEFDPEAKLFHGHVIDLKDVITFQSQDAAKLEKEFQISVDTYLEFCQELGQDPEKPYSGIFNLRISPELHHRAHVRAAEEDMSINAFAAYAIERMIEIGLDAHPEEEPITQKGWGKFPFWESSDTTKWESANSYFPDYIETVKNSAKRTGTAFKKPEAFRENVDVQTSAA